MNGKLLILLLIAPTIALILIAIIGALLAKFRRRQCPACLQRGLKSVSVVRAFTQNRAGDQTPEYWSYLICEKCGERFKLRNGMLTGVPEDEMTEAKKFG